MIAASRAVVEAARGGRISYVVLRSAAPLLLRPTAESLYLVGGAAGPLGGDEVDLDLQIGPGAALTVRSAAATVARPGPIVGQWSRFRISVDLAARATLRWLPEPGVASAGCRHAVEVDVRLARDCDLLWRDELLLGRHGEPAGSWSSTLRVDLDGRALLRQRLDVGPHAPGFDGPAVLGDSRAVGSVLIVAPGAGGADDTAVAPAGHDHGPVLEPTGAARARVMSLAGPATLVSALAPTATCLRQILEDHSRNLLYPEP